MKHKANNRIAKRLGLIMLWDCAFDCLVWRFCPASFVDIEIPVWCAHCGIRITLNLKQTSLKDIRDVSADQVFIAYIASAGVYPSLLHLTYPIPSLSCVPIWLLVVNLIMHSERHTCNTSPDHAPFLLRLLLLLLLLPPPLAAKPACTGAQLAY